MVLAKQRSDVIWNRYNFPISMEGCVLYAPLWQEDMKGNTFLSYDQYHHVLTPTGTTHGSQGRTFNGTSDKISVAQHASLQNLTAKSVFIWHKSSAFTATSRYIYDDGYGETNFGVRIFCLDVSNNINIWVKNSAGTVVAEQFAFTVGAWELIGFTWDGTTVHYYSNAVEQGTGDALSGTIAASDDTLTLGASTPASGSFYDGTIGEALVYSRALTAAEAMNIYPAMKWKYGL